MDSTSIVLIIALFAIIVVAGFLVFRKSVKAKIDGPLGMKLDMDASNQPSESKPAIRIRDAECSGGGILAEDNHGAGVEINKVKVADDIIATSSKKK
jgi:hypothetical protein